MISNLLIITKLELVMLINNYCSLLIQSGDCSYVRLLFIRLLFIRTVHRYCSPEKKKILPVDRIGGCHQVGLLVPIPTSCFGCGASLV